MEVFMKFLMIAVLLTSVTTSAFAANSQDLENQTITLDAADFNRVDATAMAREKLINDVREGNPDLQSLSDQEVMEIIKEALALPPM
jgi:hypothetical protein